MWKKRMLNNLDWPFVGLIFVLLAASLVVLSSASQNIILSDPYYYVKKQALWMVLGIVVAAITAYFSYQTFPRWAKFAYIFMILILVGVFFVPSQSGVQRWYDLGFMDFQPSELSKIITIVAFACFLKKRQAKMHLWSTFFLSLLFLGLPLVLIILEPDLGTGLVFIALWIGMMWVAGFPTKRMIIILLILFLLVGLIFVDLYIGTDGFTHSLEEGDLPIPLPFSNYQIMRLIIFVNPGMDPLKSGYQIIQSEVAIGSGGMLGKGYGQGSQVQGNFLPTHHTDFIFAVIGEEFGLLGCFVFLGTYLLLLLRAVRIALDAKDMLGTLIVAGVITMFAFQILVNVGMTTGIMPVTGLPLPLFTYGGTSMLVSMCALGLIINVSLRRREILF